MIGKLFDDAMVVKWLTGEPLGQGRSFARQMHIVLQHPEQEILWPLIGAHVEQRLYFL